MHSTPQRTRPRGNHTHLILPYRGTNAKKSRAERHNVHNESSGSRSSIKARETRLIDRPALSDSSLLPAFTLSSNESNALNESINKNCFQMKSKPVDYHSFQIDSYWQLDDKAGKSWQECLVFRTKLPSNSNRVTILPYSLLKRRLVPKTLVYPDSSVSSILTRESYIFMMGPAVDRNCLEMYEVECSICRIGIGLWSFNTYLDHRAIPECRE